MESSSTSKSVQSTLSLRLSERARESIKTALAMTIAYAIALMMDWDRAYWAAFAVAFVSLTTIGQSVTRAALRMAGTLMAIVVSLLIISVSAQDRWLFIVLLSLYTSLCAYLLSGSKVSYFWQVGGFVTAIVCFNSGPDPVNAFNTAVLRAQETGMGILVYTLVALFLWPNSSRTSFFASTTTLIGAQIEAFRHCAELSRGQSPTAEAGKLEAAENQAQSSFSALLLAAEADTTEVMEQKAGWRAFQRQSAALTIALQHWRDSLNDIAHLQLINAFPNMDEFNSEITARLTAIDDMLKQSSPRIEPRKVDLPADLQAVETLSHYDRAGLAVARSHMEAVEELTRELFTTVARLRGFAQQSAALEVIRTPFQFSLPDPDRLLATARFALMQWTAFLAVIYIGDLPGSFGFVSIVAALGIALVHVPGFKVKTLIAPAGYALIFAACIYLLVMPHLSSYGQLAPVIFAATFMICYFNFKPQQTLGRALGLALFAMICAISNEQSYSFISVTTTAMMFGMLFVLLAAFTHLPVSMRPEDVFMRMLKRFFRSAQFTLDASPTDWRYGYHVREVASLPAKLSAWVGHINPQFLPTDGPQQTRLLISRLQLLSVRLSQLTGMSADSLAAVTPAFRSDLQSWRQQISASIADLAGSLQGSAQATVSDAPIAARDESEQRITAKLSGSEGDILNTAEARDLYLLLGAYRGVDEALIAAREQAAQIDWQTLQEPRFA